MISVRGSGDTLNTIGYIGVKISARLSARAQALGVKYGALGVDYPAVGIDWWKLTPTGLPVLFVQYQRSKNEGRDKLRQMLREQVRVCPEQRLVVVGYSQGAHAVADAFSRKGSGLTHAQLDHVAAVVLIADPRFNSKEPFATGQNLRSGHNGILGARSPGDLSELKGKVRSWCRRGDLVCQGLPGSTAAHAPDRYLEDYAPEIVDYVATKLGWTPGRIAAAGSHTCAVTVTGEVKCWGLNDHGQLGDGTKENRVSPTSVDLPAEAIAVSSQHKHSCALVVDGRVFCWGSNTTGQLGDGTTKTRLRPVAVKGLPRDIASVSVAAEHTCALTRSGVAWCWGEGGNGQLGPGTPYYGDVNTSPIRLVGFPGRVVSLSAGGYHTCGVSSGGGAFCWGNNAYGEAGHGRPGSHSEPLPVVGLESGVTEVSAGVFQTYALVRGRVYFWGATNFMSTTSGIRRPIPVVGLETGTRVLSAGESGGRCAITGSRGVACVQVSARPRASAVPGLARVVSLAAGGEHACALLVDGTLVCWGSNDFGQLGDGTTKGKARPVEVKGL